MTEMIASLEQALALSPENAPLRMQLAQLLANALRWNEAEEHFKQLLARTPSDQKAKLGLANVFRRTDRLSAAIVIYDELHERGMRDPNFLITYSKALVKDGSMEKAQEIYRVLVTASPNMADEELDGLFRQAYAEEIGRASCRERV